MSEAAKRPCSTEEDESDYVEWSLEYDLKNYQSLRSSRRNFSFQREWNQLKSGDVSSSRWTRGKRRSSLFRNPFLCQSTTKR